MSLTLAGFLVTSEDYYAFAEIRLTPPGSGFEMGEDVAEWLSQWPDGTRVTITVAPEHGPSLV